MKKQLAQNTIITYQLILKKFEKDYKIFNTKNIIDFLKGASKTYISVCFSALKNKFQEQGNELLWINKLHNDFIYNSCTDLIRENKPLTDDEIAQIKNSNFTDKHIILFLIYTGIRADELINLKNEWDGSSVVIHFIGKGNQRRITFIPSFLFEWFKNTSLPTYYSKLQRIFKNCRQHLNWTRLFVPHTARYTFASLLNARGVNLTDIAKLMGHRDPKTTFRYLANDTNDLFKIWSMLFEPTYKIREINLLQQTIINKDNEIKILKNEIEALKTIRKECD